MGRNLNKCLDAPPSSPYNGSCSRLCNVLEDMRELSEVRYLEPG
jgi:hypothetical protein